MHKVYQFFLETYTGKLIPVGFFRTFEEGMQHVNTIIEKSNGDEIAYIPFNIAECKEEDLEFGLKFNLHDASMPDFTVRGVIFEATDEQIHVLCDPND